MTAEDTKSAKWFCELIELKDFAIYLFDLCKKRSVGLSKIRRPSSASMH